MNKIFKIDCGGGTMVLRLPAAQKQSFIALLYLMSRELPIRSRGSLSRAESRFS